MSVRPLRSQQRGRAGGHPVRPPESPDGEPAVRDFAGLFGSEGACPTRRSARLAGICAQAMQRPNVQW